MESFQKGQDIEDQITSGSCERVTVPLITTFMFCPEREEEGEKISLQLFSRETSTQVKKNSLKIPLSFNYLTLKACAFFLGKVNFVES